ncbi:MAG: ShlB/FhaC/HecB family hemolysin secretion/activation protein [Elusimicrobia bacterium]|nr:ShlB/FhaC/HecB family hemolysin secretion/activation protein [Elusimicrobiota bacterium]
MTGLNSRLTATALVSLCLLFGVPPARAEGGPIADPETVLVDTLIGLVLVNDVDSVVRQGLTSVRGVHVNGMPLLDTPDFKARMAKYLGRPLTKGGRVRILDEIALYCRKRGQPFVDVSILPQDVTDGVLQILVLQAKVGTVRVMGNRWFRSDKMAEQMRAKAGDQLDVNSITEDLDWLNRNPFRQVDLVYVKGAEFGQANLLLRQVDQFPLRVYGGYDDSGTLQTQHERYSLGGDWGNVFGGDGVASYQFLTSPDFRSFRAHSGSFTQPLPWRHVLTVFGSYADIKANLPRPFDLGGYNWQASVRYEVPLRGVRAYRHSLTAGFDYKQTNNNLTFGGVSVFGVATDVAQWSLGYGSRLKDSLGETTLRATGFISPGGFTPHNRNDDFRVSRADSRSRYAYVKVERNRTTQLPAGFMLVNLLTLQQSDANLLPSEQLGFGGYDTVRGYDTRVFNSDSGFLVTAELRSPALRGLSALPALESFPDKWQILAFVDYGAGSSHLRLPGERADTKLLGAGPGFRYTVSKYVSFRADYGWQLLNQAETARPYASRSHLGLVVRY